MKRREGHEGTGAEMKVMLPVGNTRSHRKRKEGFSPRTFTRRVADTFTSDEGPGTAKEYVYVVLGQPVLGNFYSSPKKLMYILLST